jgi:hypothetical protein
MKLKYETKFIVRLKHSNFEIFVIHKAYLSYGSKPSE